VFLGPPGVGKGTQCKRIAAENGWGIISTGEMLRKAIAEKTPLGISVQQFLDSGKLVPDQIVFELVEERLKERDCREGCILDGFPRTEEQAKLLDELLGRKEAKIAATITLCAKDQELRRRMLSRAAQEGRSDDTPATIQQRLQVYHELTAPLIKYYRQRGCLYEVDGMGTPDQVSQLIRNVVHSVAR
jgi:adenylate kinase